MGGNGVRCVDILLGPSQYIAVVVLELGVNLQLNLVEAIIGNHDAMLVGVVHIRVDVLGDHAVAVHRVELLNLVEVEILAVEIADHRMTASSSVYIVNPVIRVVKRLDYAVLNLGHGGGARSAVLPLDADVDTANHRIAEIVQWGLLISKRGGHIYVVKHWVPQNIPLQLKPFI